MAAAAITGDPPGIIANPKIRTGWMKAPGGLETFSPPAKVPETWEGIGGSAGD